MKFTAFILFIFSWSFLPAKEELVLPAEPKVATDSGEVWFNAEGEAVREVRAEEKTPDSWVPAWVLREREISSGSKDRRRNYYHRSRGNSYPAWFYGYPSYGRGFYGGSVFGNGYYGSSYPTGGCKYTPLPRARFQAGFRKGGFSIYLKR